MHVIEEQIRINQFLNDSEILRVSAHCTVRKVHYLFADAYENLSNFCDFQSGIFF